MSRQPTPEEQRAFLENRDELVRTFFAQVPHNVALGVELIETAPGKVTMLLPWQERLVGNPLRGILHGGVITAALDAACGGAVFMALDKPQGAATLDLRIDYVKSAEKGRSIVAEAECYHMASSIAFARGIAYHEGDPDDLVASVTGTFMIGNR